MLVILENLATCDRGAEVNGTAFDLSESEDEAAEEAPAEQPPVRGPRGVPSL